MFGIHWGDSIREKQNILSPNIDIPTCTPPPPLIPPCQDNCKVLKIASDHHPNPGKESYPQGISVFETWNRLIPPKYPSSRVFKWALVGNARTELSRGTGHGSLNWLRANIQRIHLCTLVLDPSKYNKL